MSYSTTTARVKNYYVDYQNHVTGANVTRWYVNEMVVQKRFASYIQIPGKTDGRDKPRYLRKSETKI